MADDSTPSDEPDDEQHAETFESVGEMLHGAFGPGPLGSDAGVSLSTRMQVAIESMQTAYALHQIADHIEQHEDMDFQDFRTYKDGSAEDQAMMFGVSLVGDGMQHLSEALKSTIDDDGDGDNPFKVSDGDDPIY